MASRGINKVILVGNLGQDPEIKTFANGDQLASISVATSESWRDKNTGETREKSEWHRVSVFGNSASYISNYARKGIQVYVEGQLQTRKWQDQNGQDRYTTEVVVRWPIGSIQLVGKVGQSEHGQQSPAGNTNSTPNVPSSGFANQSTVGSGQSNGVNVGVSPTNWDEIDDDIPF